MRTNAAVVLTLASFCLAGCVSTKEYDAYTRLRVTETEAETHRYRPEASTESQIRAAFAATPYVPLPTRIAIYEHTHTSGDYEAYPNENQEIVIGLLEKSEKIVRADAVTSVVARGEASIKELRLAAAKHQAELLMICDSDFRVRVKYSPIAALNVTIVGAYIVPSTTVEVECRVAAHVLNTRTGRIYISRIRNKSWSGFLPSGLGNGTVRRKRRELGAEIYKELIPELMARLDTRVQPDGTTYSTKP